MTWCPLPFRHVFVEPRGVKPCCSYTKMHEGSVDSWLSSQELNDLQRTILDGQTPEGCRYCAQGEARDGSSTRTGALNDYGADVNKNTQIDYVDYRASNVCNFRCRMCEPFYSNGIAQEARRFPELQKFYAVPEHKVAHSANRDWVIDNLESIKRLMFTGGEPTKIPEVREIIDEIRKRNLKDISVMITSNASFSDPYWFEITKSMNNIHWTLSVDSVGTAAELIRDGTDWAQVSDTVEQMFDIAPSVNIGTVVTNLNLTQLDLLFAWANGLKDRYDHRSNGRTHFIEICNWPRHFSPYNWPAEKIPEIKGYLENIILHSSDLQPKQLQIVENILTTLQTTQPDAELWQRFVDFNTLLDQTRHQDHRVLLELH